jgi:ribose transport system ATP-binding protein
MEEVFRLADRIAVLRDGTNAGEFDPKKTTVETTVAAMVGRVRSQWFPHRKSGPRSPVVLRVKDVVVAGSPHPISFDARRGEILGFAGLVGSGRTELMQVLFGIDAPISGTMEVMGQPYRPRKPADAIRAGVLLAPEDRKKHGLVLPASLHENVALPATAPSYWLRPPRFFSEHQSSVAAIEKLNIRAHSPRQKAATLSGGNQQKVVLAKWLALGPKVLILDEPTRGIDVGAKAEIYDRIVELADSGICVLLVSSDMEELLGIADRVVVLHERRLSGIVERAELSEERLMSLMTGTHRPKRE